MTVLNSAALMNLSLCVYVCFMRFFGRFKGSKVDSFSIGNNSSNPFFSICKNTKKAACFIVLVCFLYVLRIYKCIRDPKIQNSVVQFIAIYMVNKATRPLSKRVEPSKSMGGMRNSIDSNYSVIRAGTFEFSTFFSNAKKGEKSCFAVVCKKFFESACGKIASSHDALLLLIGEKPRCVSSTSGLRYFRAC